MTPGCTAEACSLRDNYHALMKAGYEVLGVSTDNEKSHQKFIAKEKLPFRLLADTDRKLHEAYDTWVKKSMYGREYMGTARVTYVIDEVGVIAEVIEKVDTKNHAQQILGGVLVAKVNPVKKSSEETIFKSREKIGNPKSASQKKYEKAGEIGPITGKPF